MIGIVDVERESIQRGVMIVVTIAYTQQEMAELSPLHAVNNRGGIMPAGLGQPQLVM
jgi:hypothetical protein